MPNVKIFVDDAVFDELRDALAAALLPLREAICAQLSVPVVACQLAVIPVMGIEGQPIVNMEIQYLAKAERTPAVIEAACTVFRAVIEGFIGSTPAVRATPLDPDTYVALKV